MWETAHFDHEFFDTPEELEEFCFKYEPKIFGVVHDGKRYVLFYTWYISEDEGE